MVDHQLAIDVVVFMLYDACGNTFILLFVGFKLLILVADADLRLAADVFTQFGESSGNLH